MRTKKAIVGIALICIGISILAWIGVLSIISVRSSSDCEVLDFGGTKYEIDFNTGKVYTQPQKKENKILPYVILIAIVSVGLSFIIGGGLILYKTSRKNVIKQ